MPDYAYYCDHYLGEDIPETEFAACMRRAEGKLAYMKEVYAVQPRKGLTAEEAENMALCAIADAVYEFKQEDEARGLTRVTVGSVSESYAEPPELCAATLSGRAAHYRHEAGYYLRIGRWLNG